MNNSTVQIKRAAIISYITIAISILIGITYTPWMIRQIGQSNYGLYTLAVTLISFFTIDFGLGEAVSRFLSKYIAQNQKDKVSDFLGITFKIYVIIDVVVIITVSVVYKYIDIIYAELTPAEMEMFRCIFILAVMYAVASFPFQPLNGVLIANEKFVFYKLVDLLNKLLTTLTMVVVLVLGYRVYALVIVNIIFGIFVILLKLFYVIKNHLIYVNLKARDKVILKEIFKYTFWTAMIMVAQRFIFNIMPTILATNSGTREISIFGIASTIEGYVWIVASALNGLFLPRVTNMLVANKSMDEIEELMARIGRIQLYIIGGIFAIFLPMGKEFVTIWVGKDFILSYYIILLLIAPGLITLTQQIATTALIAKNEIKYRSVGAIIVASLSVSLAFFLTPQIGALGAGIAICIGTICGSVIFMNIVYRKVLKIDLAKFFKECHLKIIPILVIISLLGVILQRYFASDNIFVLLVKIIILLFIYLILLWNLTFNNYEKGIFRNLLNRKK